MAVMSETMVIPDGPEVTRAKRLMGDLKRRGFVFQRIAPGPDGPVLGRRETGPWVDTIYLAGFSEDCLAWRQRRSLLIVPGLGLPGRQISGGALVVLGDVVTWET